MAELRRITLTADRREGDRFRLTDEVRHYLRRVLRLGIGDRCLVADGAGQIWEVELVNGSPIEESDRLAFDARILTEVSHHGFNQTGLTSPELPIPLVLLAAVPKGNGFDEVVRQVTELGVASIVPVTSDRTVLDPSPKRVDRWRRIATEAFEQCERVIVPQVLPPQRFDHWLKTQPLHIGDRPLSPLPNPASSLKAIAVARSDAPSLRQLILNDEILTESEDLPHKPPSAIIIAIGPEGGWTPRERGLAIEAGFREISLGCRVLRAVTASVAAVAIGADAITSLRSNV
ncbi:MAG: 16S rRNA (uracil(1498)-N(3))-methyltransferase [Oscillatoriales cyanobacterium]|nr:MAG: 16S rRNA (uracil(1498)-N(3))-methyltransferase [Oscillatoriales cyanobacterium]